jgi:hypothetical protein
MTPSENGTGAGGGDLQAGNERLRRQLGEAT